MIKKNKILSLLSILIFVLLCSNCSSSENYLLGLDSYKAGNFSSATKFFEKSIKSENCVEQYLALKKLCSMENISSEKKLKCSKTVAKSKNVFEFEVYNLYVQSLLDCKKYEKCISEAEKYLSFEEKTRNQKIHLEYCKAVSIVKKNLEKNKFYNFEDDFVKYFILEEFNSEYHSKFFAEFKNQNYKLKELLEFRVSVYEKNFSKAKKLFDLGLENFLELDKVSCALLSDFGKFSLTGNAGNYLDLAKKFDVAFNLVNIEKEESYYLAYYTARLYEKGRNFEKAKSFYLKASECAKNDSAFDDVMWYYLRLLKNESEKSFVEGLKKYGNSFKNKNVYSDLFEELFLSQLSSKRWESFASIFEEVSNFASQSINAPYDYILARLLQEGFVSKNSVKIDEKSLFQKVVENQASSTYYLVLSAEQLGFSPEEALLKIFSTENFVSKNKKVTEDVTSLMKSCLKKKNIRELYSIYSMYKEYVSSETCVYFAKKVNKIAEKENQFYPYVLRLASNASYSAGKGKDLDLLKLYYPQFYKKEIQAMSKKYSLYEDLLFGLIHSESFFNKDVVSKSGAVGLCQLMEATAFDIAKKLKVSDFDLTDASVNVEFGSFYLAELIRRLDGSIMDAIVSYNSGITRVRNWHKIYTDVPIDIFIEMLPFEESRTYGKKVLSASVVYGYLYYGKTTAEVTSSLLN